jgi:hypothetical protein
MNINVIYGQGAANNAAPSGFYTAVNYVVNYYDTLFTNNVTININISYGSILDPYTNTYSNVSSGDLGESYDNNETTYSYAATRNILLGENAPGASTLPSNSPVPGSLSIGSAEAKALGLIGASSALDGSVGIAAASANTAWDYSATTTPTANQYYLVGVLEHEISEGMGRVSDLGPGGQYTVTDLYRYSSAGVRDLTPGGKGSTAYFSIDNGTTNLGTWNNQISNGDLADWYPQGPGPGGNDAYNDYNNPGVINAVSPTDIILMQALGWTIGGPTATSLTAAADNQATTVTAGHVVTITVTTSAAVAVTGTPTLQLNDNEVALYTSGSGSNTLTFTYTVQLGDNVADLQVTGLTLPSGALIQSVSLANLAGGVTGDLALAINTTTTPTTTVQQEILGLYAALYNRASDFPGYSYWAAFVGQQPDAIGVTLANAGSTAITLNDEQVMGQAFVNTQSTFFNQTYGSLTDIQFINALYVNIGGNAGDPGGVTYWTNFLQQAEGSSPTAAQITAARAGLVGQFVHDLIDVNLATFTMLTPAQLLAAEQRQETIDNKIAVSLAYSNTSQLSGGTILDPHTIGDTAYQAAITAIHGVTSVATTADIAIIGIHNAVANQNLQLVV